MSQTSLQMEEAFAVQEYARTHTHTHTHTCTHTHTNTDLGAYSSK